MLPHTLMHVLDIHLTPHRYNLFNVRISCSNISHINCYCDWVWKILIESEFNVLAYMLRCFLIHWCMISSSIDTSPGTNFVQCLRWCSNISYQYCIFIPPCPKYCVELSWYISKTLSAPQAMRKKIRWSLKTNLGFSNPIDRSWNLLLWNRREYKHRKAVLKECSPWRFNQNRLLGERCLTLNKLLYGI